MNSMHILKKMSDQKVEQKLQFVFVHGAGHGVWCWYNIRSLLESVGHKVTCIDLRGGDIDLIDANTIKTFKEFNELILVGHSAGELNITEILHKFPNNIHVAVYIAAIMMKNVISIPHGTWYFWRDSGIMARDNILHHIFIARFILLTNHCNSPISNPRHSPIPSRCLIGSWLS
ncbi:hypothetical protein UlMin_030127 [Ulmus minor]